MQNRNTFNSNQKKNKTIFSLLANYLVYTQYSQASAA